MSALLCACDLRLSDVGTQVTFEARFPHGDDTVTGQLLGVASPRLGVTSLAVSGHIYLLGQDALVEVPTDAAIRIGAEPGRSGVWERANRVKQLRDIVDGPPAPRCPAVLELYGEVSRCEFDADHAGPHRTTAWHPRGTSWSTRAANA